jgi:hypothetical protein
MLASARGTAAFATVREQIEARSCAIYDALYGDHSGRTWRDRSRDELAARPRCRLAPVASRAAAAEKPRGPGRVISGTQLLQRLLSGPAPVQCGVREETKACRRAQPRSGSRRSWYRGPEDAPDGGRHSTMPSRGRRGW